jgi:hypothetical protein
MQIIVSQDGIPAYMLLWKVKDCIQSCLTEKLKAKKLNPNDYVCKSVEYDKVKKAYVCQLEKGNHHAKAN